MASAVRIRAVALACRVAIQRLVNRRADVAPFGPVLIRITNAPTGPVGRDRATETAPAVSRRMDKRDLGAAVQVFVRMGTARWCVPRTAPSGKGAARATMERFRSAAWNHPVAIPGSARLHVQLTDNARAEAARGVSAGSNAIAGSTVDARATGTSWRCAWAPRRKPNVRSGRDSPAIRARCVPIQPDRANRARQLVG